MAAVRTEEASPRPREAIPDDGFEVDGAVFEGISQRWLGILSEFKTPLESAQPASSIEATSGPRS